jgi:endonuclease/exonuclease/phosphatase family metal-dependent hydrolase
VVTYNVFGDPSGANERASALMAELEEADADILAFQEASSWFLDRLHRQPWVSAYAGTAIGGERLSPSGLYLLSKYPIEGCGVIDLPGDEGRAVLYADIRVHDISVRAAVIHLAADLDGRKIRTEQLQVVFDLLRDADHGLLLGDFNFGDREPEDWSLEAPYRDLWAELRPGEAGYTFDLANNPMAQNNAFACERSRRLDRILLRSEEWREASITLMGDRALAGSPALFPSDHFGVIAELVLPGGWVAQQ